MPDRQFKTWDQYAAEAEIPPFELQVSPDETLQFTTPSGTALMRITDGLRTGDLELILSSLAGDHWPRMLELIDTAGHQVVAALTEDTMDHFKLYEDVVLIGPGGGRVTRSRPTQIQAMLNQGYRPAGEARAS
jgi:hypothetical protein